jgi:hypothetical protein
MERGAKYTNPGEAAAAMVASIEANDYPAIHTRGVRRNAFLSIILEKGIELRNRLPEDPAPPEFDASLKFKNIAEFRAFFEFIDSGGRSGRALADMLNTNSAELISQQARVVLTYLMARINELPRRTLAHARAPSGHDLSGDVEEEHKAT